MLQEELLGANTELMRAEEYLIALRNEEPRLTSLDRRLGRCLITLGVLALLLLLCQSVRASLLLFLITPVLLSLGYWLLGHGREIEHRYAEDLADAEWEARTCKRRRDELTERRSAADIAKARLEWLDREIEATQEAIRCIEATAGGPAGAP